MLEQNNTKELTMDDNNNDAVKQRKYVQAVLDKLISDEWFAGNTYKQFVVLACPQAREQIKDLMLETADDELDDHYASLVEFAQQNGYDVPSTYAEMKKHAEKTDVKLFESCKKGQDALFYFTEGVKSEERAIETYEKYVDDNDVKNTEPQLQVIIKSNYYDEQQHLEDF